MYMPNNNDLTAMSNYLTSPNFKANTSLGDFLQNGTSMSAFPSAPAMGSGGLAGGFGGMGGMDELKMLVGGLSSIGNLWNSFQATKIAKDTLKFQKEYAQKNMTNQVQSYNTALSDRITSRAFAQGNDQAYVDDYLSKNKLSA